MPDPRGELQGFLRRLVQQELRACDAAKGGRRDARLSPPAPLRRCPKMVGAQPGRATDLDHARDARLPRRLGLLRHLGRRRPWTLRLLQAYRAARDRGRPRRQAPLPRPRPYPIRQRRRAGDRVVCLRDFFAQNRLRLRPRPAAARRAGGCGLHVGHRQDYQAAAHRLCRRLAGRMHRD